MIQWSSFSTQKSTKVWNQYLTNSDWEFEDGVMLFCLITKEKWWIEHWLHAGRDCWTPWHLLFQSSIVPHGCGVMSTSPYSLCLLLAAQTISVLATKKNDCPNQTVEGIPAKERCHKIRAHEGMKQSRDNNSIHSWPCSLSDWSQGWGVRQSDPWLPQGDRRPCIQKIVNVTCHLSAGENCNCQLARGHLCKRKKQSAISAKNSDGLLKWPYLPRTFMPDGRKHFLGKNKQILVGFQRPLCWSRTLESEPPQNTLVFGFWRRTQR